MNNGHVALTVLSNLQDQHDWTQLEIIRLPELKTDVVKGLPPRLLYLHPDDQIAALAQDTAGIQKPDNDPVVEWVLPVQLADTWSLSKLASVFDALRTNWTHDQRKRIILATLHNDSTVVYYFVHEGMVKPRQN
ncbi:hypothetical protein VHEMI01474 [[Torrubiella] hemipterigena]|uniref:tRNA-splicing endonuclease subunit Sen15 domain-containing protein n=1 Tax=[Torrubiella] hemipterigena TaxID=1531966 RepID=A0A0A1ST57_9HYPO|nr:hypothetical protein VHEMI01474 [[Torrubiella] hemipterigena]